MKQMFAVVAGVVLLASSWAPADAAKVGEPKGMQNSKKVMQHTKERYLQVEKAKKTVHAQREARRKQPGAAPAAGN